MKFINAEVGFQQVVRAASCRLELALAGFALKVWSRRLQGLGSRRDADRRVAVGYKVRYSQVAYELACQKMKSI